jgi:hypothetical protein
MGEIAGLIYRNLEFIPGEDPRLASGAAAVAQTFRSLRNQGIAHWLEDTPHAYFFTDHYTFRDINVVPEKYWQQAIRAMGILNRQLPKMWSDPAHLEKNGHDLMIALNEIQGDQNLGWAMATVIAAKLGDERLREAGRTVPGFVSAFQEAAARNPVPVPALSEVGGRYDRAMPPFTEEAWRGLSELLAEFFPVPQE